MNKNNLKTILDFFYNEEIEKQILKQFYKSI